MTDNVIKLGRKISPQHRRPTIKKVRPAKSPVVAEEKPKAKEPEKEVLEPLPHDSLDLDIEPNKEPLEESHSRKKRTRRKPVEDSKEPESELEIEVLKADNTPVEES